MLCWVWLDRFVVVFRVEKVWVLNIVFVIELDIFLIIYDRGFIGMYYNWCEFYSIYFRIYDFFYVDYLIIFVKVK